MIVSKSHNCPYRRTPHSNLAYVEYENGHWCYSCNRGDIKADDYYAFSVRNSRTANTKVDTLEGTITNPKQFPLDLLAWLYKYYVFDSTIVRFNIMATSDSLIFPVIENNSIVAYQQRFFPSKRFFSSNTNNYIFSVCDKSDSNRVILVEDYISAVRLAEIENVVCLFGTNLKDNYLDMVSSFKEIFIWLDNDEAGIKARSKILKKLNNYINTRMQQQAFSDNKNWRIKIIESDKDPKEYTNEEIRIFLS